MTLRKYTGTGSAPLATWIDTPAIAKSIPANTEELTAGINMTGRRLILSPTSAGSFAPTTGKDAIIQAGAKRVIQVWSPFRVGADVVRIEVQVS